MERTTPAHPARLTAGCERIRRAFPVIRRLAVLTLVFAASAAMADEATSVLVARAMPYDPYARSSEIGHGAGIVFTPDLSVPGTSRLYESPGFACFEDAASTRVPEDIRP